eukprot:s136_g5.t1
MVAALVVVLVVVKVTVVVVAALPIATVRTLMVSANIAIIVIIKVMAIIILILVFLIIIAITNSYRKSAHGVASFTAVADICGGDDSDGEDAGIALDCFDCNYGSGDVQDDG